MTLLKKIFLWLTSDNKVDKCSDCGVKKEMIFIPRDFTPQYCTGCGKMIDSYVDESRENQ
jgi:hypothetical protein